MSETMGLFAMGLLAYYVPFTMPLLLYGRITMGLLLWAYYHGSITMHVLHNHYKHLSLYSPTANQCELYYNI